MHTSSNCRIDSETSTHRNPFFSESDLIGEKRDLEIGVVILFQKPTHHFWWYPKLGMHFHMFWVLFLDKLFRKTTTQFLSEPVLEVFPYTP